MDFSNCFQNNLHIIKQIENWQKVFISYVRSLFRKVRITRKKPLAPKIYEAIDLQNWLTAEDDCNQEIEHLNDVISDMEAKMKQDYGTI